MPDETVFAAARRNGLDWPTRCMGRASCRQCYFYVDEESRALSEPSRLETDALKRAAAEDGAGFRVRLACQTKVLADVVVRRMGVHLMRPASSDAKPTDHIELGT